MVSLGPGEGDLLRQIETTLACADCGRATPHRAICVGSRMVRVQCARCGRCVGLEAEDVVRLFVEEVVLRTLRLPGETVRGIRGTFGAAVGALPRHLTSMPVMFIRDALRLRRIAVGVGEAQFTEGIFNQAESRLPCTTCGRETAHRILYLWRRIAEVRCEACGRAIRMSREEALAAFAADAVVRVRRLPTHLRQELRDDFGRAVRAVPGKALRMPLTVARDLCRLIHIVGTGRRPDKLLAS